MDLSAKLPMGKTEQEVRDAVHGFVHFKNLEKSLIDSVPSQKPRAIHQLALSYEAYAGASHKRFEHCMGVMEVAGQILTGWGRPAVQHSQVCECALHLPLDRSDLFELRPPPLRTYIRLGTLRATQRRTCQAIRQQALAEYLDRAGA